MYADVINLICVFKCPLNYYALFDQNRKCVLNCAPLFADPSSGSCV